MMAHVAQKELVCVSMCGGQVRVQRRRVMLFAEDPDGGAVAPLAELLIGGLPLAPCLKRSCFPLACAVRSRRHSWHRPFSTSPPLSFQGSSILCLAAAWHNTISLSIALLPPAQGYIPALHPSLFSLASCFPSPALLATMGVRGS